VQATQLLLAPSQTGVAPVQAAALLVVHCTQTFLLVSQTDVGAEQSASALHCSHLPAFAPVVVQCVERQTRAPFVSVHGPSPFT
jgi:hypothetical protein